MKANKPTKRKCPDCKSVLYSKGSGVYYCRQCKKYDFSRWSSGVVPPKEGARANL